MIKYKKLIWTALILSFLLFSFSPTIFLISQRDNLTDKNREFILEHNYYWPDYNLYLSKIRQGFEGKFTAVEKYTSEPHSGSLIQEFYVILGHVGRFLGLDPNNSYLLGRIILSPLLLIMIIVITGRYFPSFWWQLTAFLVVITSGSFPRIWFDQKGVIQIGRYMEWWSNIDALQRLTFIPHILFAQVVSFYLLYILAIKPFNHLTMKQLVFYILLGNLVGLVFPPSLITLNGVILLTLILKMGDARQVPFSHASLYTGSTKRVPRGRTHKFLFLIFTTPSLLYLLSMTKITPWSALVDFHRTHPMMIPLDQYILGSGPIMFLGFAGALVSIIKREKHFQPLILWVIVTLGMASFFSVVRDQSPLRFTQTGLFIPLGILGAYFFQQISQIRPIRLISLTVVIFYLVESLFMMKVSLDWQTTWLKQLIGASIPAVPYPPQTVFPLKEWMDGIRFLRDNTNHNDVVFAETTAGNYIPAYSGNFVYFGQANTVDYERKREEVDRFFKGLMSQREVELFLKQGRVKYIFYSVQEKEKGQNKPLKNFYPNIREFYKNPLVTIYQVSF